MRILWVAITFACCACMMSRLDRPSTLAQTVARVVSKLSVVSPDRLLTVVMEALEKRLDFSRGMLLLANRPAVFDLVAANPVLAWCLANNDAFRGTRDSISLEIAYGHCRHRQRDLLEWLGLKDREEETAEAAQVQRSPSEASERIRQRNEKMKKKRERKKAWNDFWDGVFKRD